MRALGLAAALLAATGCGGDRAEPLWTLSLVTSPPVVHRDGRVGFQRVTTFGGGLMVQVDLRGEDRRDATSAGGIHQPVGTRDGGYVHLGGGALEFLVDTGTELVAERRIDTGALSAASPCWSDRYEVAIVGTSDGNLVSVRPADETILWRTPLGAVPIGKIVMDADGVSYVVATRQTDGRDSLFAVDPLGVVLWEVDLGGADASPALDGDGGVVIGHYVASVYEDEQPDQHLLTTYETADGSERWSVAPGGLTTGTAIDGAGNLYLGTLTGDLAQLSVDRNGEERWRYTDLGGGGAPALAGGRVYAGCGLALCAWSAGRGTLVAEFDTDGEEVIGTPAISNGRVIVSASGVPMAFRTAAAHTDGDGWGRYGGNNRNTGERW